MPSPAACEREDRVIELIIDNLSRSGREVNLKGRPDRLPADDTGGLTVDALLQIDEECWALDVMTLRWGQQYEGFVEKLTRELNRRFGGQLRNMKRTLCVTCSVNSEKSHFQELLTMAASAMASPEGCRGIGLEEARLWPWSPGIGPVEVQPWLGQSANVREDLRLSSGNALKKKLLGQFQRAREMGYRTCLAIDQRGASDLKYGANFLAIPQIVVAFLEEIEAEVGTSLDLAAIIHENDGVSWVRP